VNDPFILRAAASDRGMAAVLLQKSPDTAKEAVKSFTSKPFTSEDDRRLAMPAKEAYAITFGLDHFRRWLLGQPLILETDHLSLMHNFNEAEANNPHFITWLLVIQEFAPMRVNHSLAKNNNFADALSRNLAFDEHCVQLSIVEREFFDRVYFVSETSITLSEEFKPFRQPRDCLRNWPKLFEHLSYLMSIC
jgi:hypothetical protein